MSSTARAVLRGFRVSWDEWTRRPDPAVAIRTEPVAPLRCWVVFQVPAAPGGDLAEPLRRR